MNKKSTLYLLLASIALISSYATSTPIIRNTEETLTYWTRDAGNGTDSTSAPPLASQSEINSNADGLNNFPIGMLFFNDPASGNLNSCTASVISTPNGNIGITAGHCLINAQGQASQNLVFSPGYDRGQDGPLGRIPVAVFQVPDKFRSTYNGVYDYGMVRFAFKNERPLQAYTGALGWKVDIGDNVQTTAVGYPFGNIPNCPNDAQTLCRWEGVTKLTSDGFYATPGGVDFGNGASGTPWIFDYNTETKLGLLYGTLTGSDKTSQESLSPVYTINDWYALLNYVSNN